MLFPNGPRWSLLDSLPLRPCSLPDAGIRIRTSLILRCRILLPNRQPITHPLFHRSRADDGSLSVTDGAASLLAGIASGYLLARGFSGGTGHYDADRRRYTATTPYVASSPYVSSDSKPSAKAAPSKGTVSNRAGGFGSAGARSAAS